MGSGHSGDAGGGGESAAGGVANHSTEHAGAPNGGATPEGGAPSSEPSGQAGSSAGGGGDAGANGDARTHGCDPTRPFDPPLFIASLASNRIDDATVSWDGLTLLVWGGDGGSELLSSSRASKEDSFAPPHTEPLLQVAGKWLAQAQRRDVPTFTGDGLTLYAEWGGEGWWAVHYATRASVLAAFDIPQIDEDLKGSGLFWPFISYDGQTMYGVRNDSAVALVSRKSAGKFATPTMILATNSPGTVSHPVVNQDETALYFSSDRTDGTAKGNGDIWVAARSTRQDDFGTPRAVNELNTAADREEPIWISSDGCEIVLLRNQYLAMARKPY